MVISDVIEVILGNRPISAAMGELLDGRTSLKARYQLDYLKWGLAGCRDEAWQEPLLELREANAAIVVPAAYADAERANAPPVVEVARFVGDHGFPLLLIDTSIKDGQDLLSWLSPRELRSIVDDLRSKGAGVALAGSLTRQHILILQRIDPDWVAVRGAVCADSERTGTIDVERVRAFKAELQA